MIAPAMDLSAIGRVLRDIGYKEGHVLQWSYTPNVVKVWWQFRRPDSRTGVMGYGASGYVSFEIYGLTEEALVRGIWGMTLRLEEHEAREFFMYGDQKPFDPHQALIKSRLIEKEE